VSRSKREPWWVDGYGSKAKAIRKRWANKKVRRSATLADGMEYKRLYCSYDICDYKWYDKDNPKVRRK